MTRKSLTATAVLLVHLAGCIREGDGNCENEGDFEAIYGMQVTGFALGENGRGYLSTILDFGKCDEGYTEGRIFIVDAVSKTAQPLSVDFWPGKVLVAPDGVSGIVMAHRDQYGLIGNAPLGVARLGPSGVTLIPLSDPVWEIQPAVDGWLVSAGSAGTLLVTTTGESLVNSLASYCGAEGAGRWLVCDGSDVRVISTTSGDLQATLPFSSDPTHIAGDATTALVLHNTSVGVVAGDTLAFTADMDGDIGQLAVVDGDFGFVSGLGSGRLLRLDSQESYEIDRFSDIVLSAGSAFSTYGELRRVLEIELDPFSMSLLYAPPGSAGDIEQAEFLPDGRILFASSFGANSLKEGEVFDFIFTEYDAVTDSWGDAWGLRVE